MNLSTRYLGLELKHPIVASSSPQSKSLDGIRRLADAGAAAITLFSLFEEQIEHEMALLGEMLDMGADSFAEASRYLPEPEKYHRGPDEYLALISDAKQSLEIPVIASLNGFSSGGWVEYAKQIEQAGADALELNVNWIETSCAVTGKEVEQRYIDVAKAVCGAVKIPVAVKIGPYFSSLAHMALQLEEEGVRGLVLFNRFYQPDIDLETREVVSSLDLSTNTELRLRLRWTAILSSLVKADLVVTGGIEKGTDVVKCLMAGAKATAVASILLKHGIEHIKHILADLTQWLEEHGEVSVSAIQGTMNQQRVADPAAFERANYMNVLKSLEEESPD
ncbi:MAG TPA: dihydroorotate dehydrogenase-like protein [Gammaproteobacteria bacterium]|nr:dihydroorotate dehydrogenase-like protein [Gammaproteobacteria bacterium]